MQQIDTLLAENGTDAAAIGAQHGLSADQTRQAMASLLPFVMGGFHKQAEAGGDAGVSQFGGFGTRRARASPATRSSATSSAPRTSAARSRRARAGRAASHRA